MSTAALQGLLEYLYGTLSPDNMLWVANHLIEQAKKEEDSELKPYTMEEINAMLDEAEANFAAGKGIPTKRHGKNGKRISPAWNKNIMN